MPKTKEWESLLEAMAEHLSPDWTTYARDHGGQAWIRLVLLVDAHHQLSTARAGEKVAQTMRDLAVDKPDEQAGWEAIEAKLAQERADLVARITDGAENLLPEDLYPMFIRSAEPTQAMP